MGQLRWTYLGDSGQQYKVGLYHGENSGHLLLYVNSSPVLIDFSVSDSKKYSLFIGDELCDLVLEQKTSEQARQHQNHFYGNCIVVVYRYIKHSGRHWLEVSPYLHSSNMYRRTHSCFSSFIRKK